MSLLHPPLPRLTGPVLRTPESRFEGLADFPYVPQYLEVGGLRIADMFDIVVDWPDRCGVGCQRGWCIELRATTSTVGDCSWAAGVECLNRPHRPTCCCPPLPLHFAVDTGKMK